MKEGAPRADIEMAAELRMVNPTKLRWSQTTAGGKERAARIHQWFTEQGGWAGGPIDAVQTPVGLVTLDHTRAAVALEQGIPSISVKIHSLDVALPTSMLERKWNRAGDTARTWGKHSELERLRKSHQSIFMDRQNHHV